MSFRANDHEDGGVMSNKTLEFKLRSTLEVRLRSIVRQYGFNQVDQSLREIGSSDHQPKHSRRSSAVPDGSVSAKPGKKRAKLSASEYITSMGLPPRKVPAITELAKRFEDKTFLPTCSDIKEFWYIYGIDKPVSRSRAAAVPRVFKFIAEMKDDDIQNMLDSGMFSGPSRLGPIADAIRRNSRT